MPKTVKVTAADREYVISEKVSGVAEKWRALLRETEIYKTLLQFDDVVTQIVAILEEGIENIKAESVFPLARLAPAFLATMSNSMDDINSLVYDYVPEMKAERDYLRENAYDSEIVLVFVEVLKLNFPILGALELMRGLKAPGTSTNLPSTNGAIGTKKNTARLKSR